MPEVAMRPYSRMQIRTKPTRQEVTNIAVQTSKRSGGEGVIQTSRLTDGLALASAARWPSKSAGASTGSTWTASYCQMTPSGFGVDTKRKSRALLDARISSAFAVSPKGARMSVLC